MKRSFLGATLSAALIAMILSCTATAQTTFLDENFDAVAGGTTPPAGWTAFIAPGALGTAIWRWDNPGARTLGGAFSGGVAGVDSDFAGGTGHDTTLRSSTFDLSAATTVRMAWDHHLRPLSGTTATVEIFDGAAYNVVFTQSGGSDIGTLTAPVSENFDVTALAGGASNAHVQFRYQSGFDWYWFVDNVKLFEPATLIGQTPRPGLAVFDINNATNANANNVASGDNGPFATTITPGTSMAMSWEGAANYPVSCFYGNVNPQSATFPGGIGQTDVGGPGLDMNGYPLGVGVFADGIGFATGLSTFSLDAFFYCGPAGTGGITLPFPSFGLAPGTELTTFQCTMAAPAAPFFYLSNAVTVITN